MTEPTPRKRRSLTNVGGEIDVAGDAEDAAKLAEALAVVPSLERSERATDGGSDEDDPARAHVHGFHTYPARMHPLTASRLVRSFTGKGDAVLDPFCGSGTVVAESLLAGRRAFGTDLNPLAIALTRSKSRPRSRHELSALVEHARACAAIADERRKGRAGATRRFPREDVDLFEPHVLLELDSLRLSLARVNDPAARADLSLVLSALLVKLSKKRGDTSDEVAPRRTAAGYTAKLFVKKTEDLARRLALFTEHLPHPAPAARVELDDATYLRTIPKRERIDAVITSPPYAATYDYVAHHALRLRWLELDARPLEEGEIGARRNYAPLEDADAAEAWGRELTRFLRAIARFMDPGAVAVLLMADSAARDTALRADEIVAALARPSGFVPAARASQEREHFHGPTRRAFRDGPRYEHALLLRRDAAAG
jgi:16S rRNA G966 N2-methylase RsmD